MVTRIITVGKTQRVKRVEFQLPLAFTEMENGNRAGTAILRGLSRLFFFHGPMDIAHNFILSLLYV